MMGRMLGQSFTSRAFATTTTQVLDLRSQLREKRQRRQILADQLAASEGVLAAHSVHQPAFDNRRAELQELSNSIASLR